MARAPNDKDRFKRQPSQPNSANQGASATWPSFFDGTVPPEPLALKTTVITISTSFTLDAVLLRSQSASVALDAVLKTSQSASFTLDAVITSTVTVTTSFTADADLFKNQSASFTANAVLKRSQSASLTVNAILRRTQSASFTANSWLIRHITTGISFNAVIGVTVTRHDRTTYHSGVDHSLDHTLARTFDVYRRGDLVHDTLVDLDARITAMENSGRRTVSRLSRFTIDAVLV